MAGALYPVHNSAGGTRGTGPGRPFGPESVPSATSAALRCLLVAGPCPGLDPRPGVCPPGPGSAATYPRSPRCQPSVVRGVPRRMSRPGGQTGRPWSQVSQSGTIEPLPAVRGRRDISGATQRSRGGAGLARIAVTVVAAGRAVSGRENSLAARMTWPHHTASRHRLAPPGSANRRYVTYGRACPGRIGPGPATAVPGSVSRERARSCLVPSVIFQREDEQ
jgi:hypothetical protein